MFRFFIILLSLCPLGVSASTNSVTVEDLGFVNGAAINDKQTQITEVLSQPDVYTLVEPKLVSKIKTLHLLKSKVISENKEGVTVETVYPLGSLQGISLLKLKLLVDGKQVPMEVDSLPNEQVVVSIPAAKHSIILRAIAPIKLTVPNHYRGPFTFNLEVEERN